MKRYPALAAAIAMAVAGCAKDEESDQEKTPAPARAGQEGGEDAGAAGGASQPTGNPHAGGAGGGPEVTVEDGVADFGAFRAEMPEGWEYSEPSSQMRLAEFSLPAEGESEPELVVYYFGEKGAGGVQANVDRWTGQFETEEPAEIEEREIAGMAATTVDVSGRYVAAVRPGADKKHDKPDYRMFAVILETPSGPYYFRMLGERDALAEHVEPALEMLESVETE